MQRHLVAAAVWYSTRNVCAVFVSLRIMYCGFHRDLCGPLGMSGISQGKPCGCNRTFSTAFMTGRLPGAGCWGNHVYRNYIYVFTKCPP